jgi:hypothetical protein
MRFIAEFLIGQWISFALNILARTAIGAGAAWLIALATGDAVYQTLVAFSLLQHPLEAWQLGATLGFLSSFLRGARS